MHQAKQPPEGIEISNIANLPTKYGKFLIQSFKEGEKEHLAIFTDSMPEIPIVRMHSECLTGDAMGSLKCDCGNQLGLAMELINKYGGMVVYLRQEGRNIGLLNKVNAYHLQDQGFDTVEANHQLGFLDDERTYDIVEKILHFYGIEKIKLLTNNPKKVKALKNIGIIERIPILSESNDCNVNYLQTKKDKMGHLF